MSLLTTKLATLQTWKVTVVRRNTIAVVHHRPELRQSVFTVIDIDKPIIGALGKEGGLGVQGPSLPHTRLDPGNLNPCLKQTNKQTNINTAMFHF